MRITIINITVIVTTLNIPASISNTTISITTITDTIAAAAFITPVTNDITSIISNTDTLPDIFNISTLNITVFTSTTTAINFTPRHRSQFYPPPLLSLPPPSPPQPQPPVCAAANLAGSHSIFPLYSTPPPLRVPAVQPQPLPATPPPPPPPPRPPTLDPRSSELESNRESSSRGDGRKMEDKALSGTPELPAAHFEPQVAMVCGGGSGGAGGAGEMARPQYHAQYMAESGRWVSDLATKAGCLKDKLDILEYCKKVYPKRDITNIVEGSHFQRVTGWCRLGHKKCKGSHAEWVKPYRCLEGPFQSDALLVPESCLFDHIHNQTRCWAFDRWNATAARACGERDLALRSFAMLLPCGISLFSGVEFVCCPKHFKDNLKPKKPVDLASLQKKEEQQQRLDDGGAAAPAPEAVAAAAAAEAPVQQTQTQQEQTQQGDGAAAVDDVAADDDDEDEEDEEADDADDADEEEAEEDAAGEQAEEGAGAAQAAAAQADAAAQAADDSASDGDEDDDEYGDEYDGSAGDGSGGSSTASPGS
ncbi:Uncharacterized protein GBIM_15532, partial [Gryllus bimaculatus]